MSEKGPDTTTERNENLYGFYNRNNDSLRPDTNYASFVDIYGSSVTSHDYAPILLSIGARPGLTLLEDETVVNFVTSAVLTTVESMVKRHGKPPEPFFLLRYFHTKIDFVLWQVAHIGSMLPYSRLCRLDKKEAMNYLWNLGLLIESSLRLLASDSIRLQGQPVLINCDSQSMKSVQSHLYLLHYCLGNGTSWPRANLPLEILSCANNYTRE